MKKKIIPFLFSLSLLASCGAKPCETHDYGDWVTTNAATCTTAGTKERTCKVCGEKETGTIDALQHDYQDAIDQTGAKAATCKEDGVVITACSKCGAKSTRVAPKTEAHNYVDATDQTGAKAPTCKEAGTVITECSVCGAKSTRVAPKTTDHQYGEWTQVDAPTHTAAGKKTRTCSVCGDVQEEAIPKTPDHSFGDTAVGTFAADHDIVGYEVYNCAAENAKKIVWDANEVSPNTKNAKYNNEDNYKVDNEGVKFGGRPVGNAMTLPAGWQSHTAVFDATVPGAFLEYNVNVKTAINNVSLSANMKPAGGLNATAGLFLSAPAGDDWTPGLIADATAESGYKITEFRYILYVNGVEVALDATKNVAAADATETKWYDFPGATFNLKAGINTIKLVQAGGWEATFYKFALTSQDGVNEVIPAVSDGYTVAFEQDSHVTGVTVYEDKACTVEDTAAVHYSRNEFGRKLKNGDGQISFAVAVESGYQVKKIIQKSPETAAYKNIKGPSDTEADTGRKDCYRITKIEDNVVFEITTEPTDTVYVGNKFTFTLGEHITGIECYDSKTYNPDTKVTGLVANVISEETGKPTTEEGQVYIKIFFDEGYTLDIAACTWVRADGNTETVPYKNIKGPADTGDNDGYRFTKVVASATITLVAKLAA